jgi:hypothetical protein
MNNTKTGGPAFPVSHDMALVAGLQNAYGMTLRDYFAAKAMQAILSEDPEYHQKYQFIDLAHFSYKCADAMLKEREE